MFIVLVLNFTAYGQSVDKKISKKTIEGWKILNENGYSIQYPENWELNQSGQMGSSFILFSPVSSAQDTFRENVNLILQDLKGTNIDMNQFVELSEDQIKTMITDSKILENNREKVGSKNYQKIIYTGKQGVFNLKFEQYYWVQHDMAYILTLTCEENQFNDFQETGEKILDSFQLN